MLVIILLDAVRHQEKDEEGYFEGLYTAQAVADATFWQDLRCLYRSGPAL